MITCVPVDSNEQWNSKVSEHFGSAPFFAIFDSEKEDLRFVENDHETGGCGNIPLLQKEKVQQIVVMGMGRGALNKMTLSRIKVLKTSSQTLNQIRESIRNQALPLMGFDEVCKHEHHAGDDCHNHK